MRVGIYTADPLLARKIQLILSEEAETEIIDDVSKSSEFDVILADCRHGLAVSADSGALMRITDREDEGEGDLPYPFSYDELTEAIRAHQSANSSRLVLDPSREFVRLDGERIRLTEVEGKLLAAILDGHGGYVSRDKLIEDVWHGTAAEGALNVYVHYLREKLEAHGEKIITSSRKCGYRIDPKYTGGDRQC